MRPYQVEPVWDPTGGGGDPPIHPPIQPPGGGPVIIPVGGPVTPAPPRGPRLGVIDPPGTLPAASPTAASAPVPVSLGDALPALGSIAQWLATPGPFGFTYGQIGLIALGVAVAFNSIGKR